jgi:hypothetical protein
MFRPSVVRAAAPSAALVLLMILASSPASAQVVYEPVQYQYWSGGRAYYYGGSNPLVHYRANVNSQHAGFARTNGYAFHSARLDTHRAVVTEPDRIYSDSTPYWNARVFGASVDDARNAAYANSATYFRKADLKYLARVEPDGTWSVPASAGAPTGTIEIKPGYRSWMKPVFTEPRPILIIPKRLLDKKLWGEPLKTADAR